MQNEVVISSTPPNVSGLATSLQLHCESLATYPSHKVTWDGCIEPILEALRTIERACKFSSVRHLIPSESIRESLDQFFEGADLEMNRAATILETNQNLHIICQLMLNTDNTLTSQQQAVLIALLDNHTPIHNQEEHDRQYIALCDTIMQFETSLECDRDRHLSIPKTMLRNEPFPPALVHDETPTDIIVILDDNLSDYLTFDCDCERLRMWGYQQINRNHKSSNAVLLVRSLKYKHTIAKLCGYRTYSAYVHRDTSIGSPSHVNALLQRLQNRMQSTIDDELTLLGDPPHWDINYAIDRWTDKVFKLREHFYFELDHTLTQVLSVICEVFGWTAQHVPMTIEGFDPNQLRCFSIFDYGERIGDLIFDPFTRDGKSEEHKWTQTISKRDGDQLPVCFITLNSHYDDDEPTLLQYEDVRTLFHEIGHTIPSLVTDYDYQILNGDWCHPDLIELSSTMVETLADHPLVLRRISKHIHTGHQLTNSKITQMLSKHNAFIGLEFRTELRDAIIDQELHNKVNLQLTYQTVSNIIDRIDVSLYKQRIPGTNDDVCSNSYIVSTDYGGILYTYLWCRVLAYQALDRVDALTTYNPKGFQQLMPLFKCGGYHDFWQVWHRLDLGTPEVDTYCSKISQQSVVNACKTQ